MQATRDERFWAKVDQTSTCWLWLGSLSAAGYGFHYSDGRKGYAHRYSYEELIGPIPAGLTIDHLCRVRHCVNPEHLEVVTARENTLRGESLSAINARRTQCHRGHPFDEVNTTWIHCSGGRIIRRCRACARERQRRYRAANT